MKSIHYLGQFELGTMVSWELGPISHGTMEIFPRNLGFILWFHEDLSSIAHANITFMDESGSGHLMCHIASYNSPNDI